MTSILPISSIIQFLTATAALLVVALLWKNRKANEVAFLIMIELNIAIWAFFYATEFSTKVLQDKIIWSQMSYLGITFLPVNFFFFILAFAQHNRFINFRNYFLVGIIPILTLVMVNTNSLHHLVWEDVNLPSGSNIMLYDHGPWFWLFWGYAFLLIGFGLFELIRLYFRDRYIKKSHITIILVATAIPVIGNLAYVTGYNPYTGFDWTTTCFVFTGLIITFGMYRHHMFEILPLATRELIRILNDGVIVLNKLGLVEDINPATRQIFSLDNDSVIKASFHEMFKQYNEFIEIVEKNDESIIDFQLKKDNDIYHYLVRILPIHNKKDQLSGKLILLTDVTSIRKSENRLEVRNQQLLNEIERNETLIADLDAFSHTVAHDLKNLLGGIYTSSEMVCEYLDEKNFEEVKEISVLIKNAALQSINVTNELLKLATAEHQDIEIAPVDMQLVFEHAKNQLKDLVSERNATIRTTESWKTVKAYAPWLIEVWVNYLGNAIKYGGNPPEITIGCSTLADGNIKYWIKDNGDGIAPTHHSALFEKHSRFHQGKALGYGLGLSIAKRIIEKMHGSVGVESTGETGKGAIFYFILPSN